MNKCTEGQSVSLAWLPKRDVLVGPRRQGQKTERGGEEEGVRHNLGGNPIVPGAGSPLQLPLRQPPLYHLLVIAFVLHAPHCSTGARSTGWQNTIPADRQRGMPMSRCGEHECTVRREGRREKGKGRGSTHLDQVGLF